MHTVHQKHHTRGIVFVVVLAAGCSVFDHIELENDGGGSSPTHCSTCDVGVTSDANADDETSADADTEQDASDADIPDAAGTDAGTEQDAGDSSIQQLCVDTINQYRATLSLPPLTRWTEKESCSDGEAKSDSITGQAHGAFGTCQEMAQNECPNWPLPIEKQILGCLQMMWDEGPGEPYSEHGHYINMTNPKYTQVACGFAVTADGKKFWSVQNFR